ncbi:MAG: hypothetical protein NZL96_01175 [Patescibacteria group bacterium]|nr:hypothetical protein [Patescibacteria group bacterium]
MSHLRAGFFSQIRSAKSYFILIFLLVLLSFFSKQLIDLNLKIVHHPDFSFICYGRSFFSELCN